MVIDWMLTLFLTTGARLSVRVMAEGRTRRDVSGLQRPAKRVVVVGAGKFGTLVARLVRENPQMGMKVVGFVDDDPIKQGKTILGERVIASTSSLAGIAAQVRAEEAVVAMPTAPQAVIDHLCATCKGAGLPVRVIPSIQALMTGTLTVQQLRESRSAGLHAATPSTLGLARHSYHRILVTGGAGFIGANFARYLLANHPECTVVVVDKLTYAGNPDNLKGLDAAYEARYAFVEADICDYPAIVRTIKEHDIDAVVNFAAETHVDRSLTDPSVFLMTNVYGTYRLLEAVRQCGVGRFHQVSTDEVYGQALRGSFAEGDPFETRSPYSATKASADCLVHAYAVSFGVMATITRGSNSIGPYQYPEKVVPLFVTNAIDGEPLPVYGDGRYVRDYQDVEDHCRGIKFVLDRGAAGEVYNIGGNAEVTSLDLARLILKKVGRPDSLIQLVEDRAGQDRRYSLNCSKVRQLGWQSAVSFEEALDRTIQWYVDNEWWWRKAKSGEYKDYFERQPQMAAGESGDHGADLTGRQLLRPPVGRRASPLERVERRDASSALHLRRRRSCPRDVVLGATGGAVRSRVRWQGFVVSDVHQNAPPRQSVEQIVGDEAWLRTRPRPLAVVIGVGDPGARLAIAGRLAAHDGIIFPHVIDPSVIFDKDSCIFERGTVVAAGCTLTVNIHLHEFVYVSRNCTIGHESAIGAGTLVNPCATLSGYVEVGTGVMVGTGATILEYRRVGDRAIVGGGALVNKDVEPGVTVVGVPARPLAGTASSSV